MVYLVRHTRVERDWEKMEGAAKALTEYWAKQPQVKGVEVWSNIAGRVDSYRFVVKFDSLADEEKWAMSIMNDPAYEAVMMKFAEVFAMDEDELIRTF